MSNLELILLSLFVSVGVCFAACAIVVIIVCCRRNARSSAKCSVQQQTSHICRVPSFSVYRHEKPNNLTASQSKDSEYDSYVNYRATQPESSLSVHDKLTVVCHTNKVGETSETESKIIDTNNDEIKGVENLTYFCKSDEFVNLDNKTDCTLRRSLEKDEHLSRTENKDGNENRSIDNDKCTHVRELNPERCHPAEFLCPDDECEMSVSDYEDIDNVQIDAVHQRITHSVRRNLTPVQKSASFHPTSVKTQENATEAERTVGRSNFYQNCESEICNPCLNMSDGDRHYSNLSNSYDSKTTVTSNFKEQPFSKLEVVKTTFDVINPRVQKDVVYSRLGEITSEHRVNEYCSLGYPLVNEVSTQSSRGNRSTSVGNQKSNASVSDVQPSLKTNTPVELTDLIPSSHPRTVLVVQEPTIHVTKPSSDTHGALFPLIETSGKVDGRQSQKPVTTDHIYYELEKQHNVEDNTINRPPSFTHIKTPGNGVCVQSQKPVTTDHIYYELEKQDNVEDNTMNRPHSFTHIKTTTPLWYSTVEIQEDTTYPTLLLSSVDLVPANHTTKSRNGNITEDISNKEEISGRFSSSNVENTTDESYSDISGHPRDKCFILSKQNAQIQYSSQQLMDPFTNNSIYYELEPESD